jgi:hypothetical protein
VVPEFTVDRLFQSIRQSSGLDDASSIPSHDVINYANYRPIDRRQFERNRRGYRFSFTITSFD